MASRPFQQESRHEHCQQRTPEAHAVTVAPPFIKRPFTSSILLWVRTDQPRQKGMDYWKGPHSKIISATPGFAEYRQLHLAESNPGMWPAIRGIETTIPADRKIDGVAEVTFKSVFSPLFGRKQTKLAHKDESNVFRRTLLYAGQPYSARWYTVGGDGAKPGSRALIYLREKDGVSTRAFRKFISDEFIGAVANTGVLKELRTQVFMPWSMKLWNTPNVAHDNPSDQRFHASLILGFTDANALRAFFIGDAVSKLSAKLPSFVSAIHAYEMPEALTYVKDGKALSQYET